MTVALPRSIPRPGMLFLTHARTVITRYRWDLLIFGGVVWSYQFLILRADAALPRDILAIGGPGFPGAFIFSCLAVFWAIRIWDGFQPGSREALLAYPVDRTLHQGVRAAAGLVLLLATLTVFWITGAVVSAIIHPGANWYTNSLLYGSSWIVSGLGVVNAYLLGTCLALLLRRPERWFFVWLPVGLVLLATTAQMLKSEVLVAIFRIVFLVLFSGLALVGSPFTDPRWRPDILIMLGSTLILAAAVVLISRFRRGA